MGSPWLGSKVRHADVRKGAAHHGVEGVGQVLFGVGTTTASPENRK